MGTGMARAAEAVKALKAVGGMLLGAVLLTGLAWALAAISCAMTGTC